jgi:hypothetical protein
VIEAAWSAAVLRVGTFLRSCSSSRHCGRSRARAEVKTPISAPSHPPAPFSRPVTRALGGLHEAVALNPAPIGQHAASPTRTAPPCAVRLQPRSPSLMARCFQSVRDRLPHSEVHLIGRLPLERRVGNLPRHLARTATGIRTCTRSSRMA